MSDGTGTHPDDKTKEDHIKDYIRSLVAVEAAMEPYKEQKRELRNSYRDNGYLTTEEMQVAVRALRFVQKNVDKDEFDSMHEIMKRIPGLSTEDNA